MELIVAGFILVLAIGITFLFTRRKSEKVRWVAWGIVSLLVITPLASWLMSMGYAIIEGEGFAGVALIMILFPLFAIISAVILIRGIFL